MSQHWGFWRWLQESRKFMAHKPAWWVYPRAALKWPAFARKQRQDRQRKTLNRAARQVMADHPNWELDFDHARDYVQHTFIGHGYLMSVIIDDLKTALKTAASADMRRVRNLTKFRKP